MVWDVGVPSLLDDTDEDWTRTPDGTKLINYTDCPPLEKCIFQCAANRRWETSQPLEDYQFSKGWTTIHFYYGVYSGETELLSGRSTYSNFPMPFGTEGGLALGASSLFTAALALLAF